MLSRGNYFVLWRDELGNAPRLVGISERKCRDIVQSVASRSSYTALLQLMNDELSFSSATAAQFGAMNARFSLFVSVLVSAVKIKINAIGFLGLVKQRLPRGNAHFGEDWHAELLYSYSYSCLLKRFNV